MSGLRDLLLLPAIWRRLVEEECQRRVQAEVRPTVERIVRQYRAAVSSDDGPFAAENADPGLVDRISAALRSSPVTLEGKSS